MFVLLPHSRGELVSDALSHVSSIQATVGQSFCLVGHIEV